MKTEEAWIYLHIFNKQKINKLQKKGIRPKNTKFKVSYRIHDYSSAFTKMKINLTKVEKR